MHSHDRTSTTTTIATSTRHDDIFVRGKSLCNELIGKLTFTEMTFFQILGAPPSPRRPRCVDACLVALMEHGLTPSAIATRLVYASAPEAMQGAVAAGLLGVGQRVRRHRRGLRRAARHGSRRHPIGAPRPRAIVAEHPPRHARRSRASATTPHPRRPAHAAPSSPSRAKHGIAAARVAALELLGAALDAAKRRHITINATGAVAAALGDAGVPAVDLRGFALIARCAGLVGHVHEEQRDPAMRAMWQAAGPRSSLPNPDDE